MRQINGAEEANERRFNEQKTREKKGYEPFLTSAGAETATFGSMEPVEKGRIEYPSDSIHINPQDSYHNSNETRSMMYSIVPSPRNVIL